jgi:ubiquinol-cytochrome c reductase cytochrome c subunit
MMSAPWARALACAATAAAALFFVHGASAAPAARQTTTTTADQQLVAHGRELYLTGCSSCHGQDATGTVLAPTLVNVGAASASFFLTTGRMPAAQPLPYQPPRKEPAYDQADIDALVAYVATLGSGPPVPNVNVASADVPAGGVIYRANCAACHQAAGAGGALSYGQYAPNLHDSTAQQVVEAIRIGPGQMPVFSPAVISDQDANNLAAYVQYLRHPDNRGGLNLGGTGPVPEGLVALVVGLGGAIFVCVWIVGRRRHATD